MFLSGAQGRTTSCALDRRPDNAFGLRWTVSDDALSETPMSVQLLTERLKTKHVLDTENLIYFMTL